MPIRARPFLYVIILAGAQLYDSTVRVPYANDASYSRDEYEWWVKNTGQPSTLYHNGVQISQEFGLADINLLGAWQRQNNAVGVKVAVIDLNTVHGNRIVALVSNTAPGSIVSLFAVSRYYSDVVAPAMVSAVNAGNRILVVATGYSTPDPLILAACEYAREHDCVIVCSVPNAPISVDLTPDYPTSFGLDNVLSVTSIDRSGNLYGAAAWGNSVIAAPGRNIIANGTYSSGTSYAAPIAAGCLALVQSRVPAITSSDLVALAKSTSLPVNGTRRIQPEVMLRIDPRDYARP